MGGLRDKVVLTKYCSWNVVIGTVNGNETNALENKTKKKKHR